MNKKKKIMIIILCVIVILIILIISLVSYIKQYLNSRGSETGDDPSQYIDSYVPTTTIEKVTNINKYYAVKTIANKYYLNLSSLNKTVENVESEVRVKAEGFSEEEYLNNIKKESKETILGMLDDEYITYSGINEDNLENKLEKYNPNCTLFVDHMYMVEESSKITTYFVYAYLRDQGTNQITELNLMVRLDSVNNTYTILPYEYMTYKNYDKVELGQEFKTNINEISNKTYNKFSYKNISENDYLIDLLESYKNNLLFNTEKAYNSLDEEYRNKRFGSIDEFRKYIVNNKKDLLLLTLDKYSVSKKDKYTEYTCIDKRGNYYIFRQTAVLDYTLILDTYTVDIDSMVAKYDDGNDEIKTLLNARKFLEAINLKDYAYAYSLLDDGFKSNYFQTQDAFEQYIKPVLYEKNTIKTYEYTAYQDVGTINLTLKNTLKEAESKNFSIVMKLNDNRKFTMSFQVN